MGKEDALNSLKAFFKASPGHLRYFVHWIREVCRDMTAFSFKDFLIYSKYWLLIWGHILKFALRRGPGIVGELIRYPWILQLLRCTRLMRRLTRGRSGLYLESICLTVHGIVVTLAELIGDIFYHKDRLILSEEMILPDIARAMGLKVWPLEIIGFLLPFLESESDLKYIDETENAGVNPDSCSLLKATTGMIIKGQMPKGLVVLSSNLPCDAGMASYSFIKHTFGTPIYRLDVPYNFYSERAERLFIEDLKGMIRWLEEHTPGRMNWDRLREICEGRNRMFELEMELWDMLRARPAPLAAEAINLSHLWFMNFFGGHKTAIRHYEKLVEMAGKNLSAGIPATPNERYRLGIWGVPFPHFIDICNKVENKYGVILINDSISYNHHTPVDTSTPDSMLRGLGQIIMQGPMVRHNRGPAENYLDDIPRMIKQFNLDMIWMANHVACKSAGALNGILREKLRKMDIPLLILDHDMLDPRIVSHDAMMNQVDHFMDNVMMMRDDDYDSP